MQQDWNDAISRAAGLWTPRFREGGSITVKTQQGENTSDGKPLCEREIDGKFERSSAQPIKNGDGDGGGEGEGGGEGGGGEDEDEAGGGGDCVLVNEHDVLQLWLPGRIIHIFSRRGIYDASVVLRDFPDLRRIAVQGNIFRDHSSQSIFEALQEVTGWRCEDEDTALTHSLLSHAGTCTYMYICIQVSSCRRAPCRPPPWVPYNAAESCKCCGSSFTWHSTFRGEAQQYRER